MLRSPTGEALNKIEEPLLEKLTYSSYSKVCVDLRTDMSKYHNLYQGLLFIALFKNT